MVGFMENESNVAEPGKQIEQFMFITSEYETRIKVKYGLQSPIEVFIPKNEVVSLLVPRFMENFNSEVVSKSLIEVSSEVPITIYAFSSVKHSSDSYSVIPISNWGNEYVVVSVPNDHYNKKTLDSIKDFTPRSSQFLIMSAYDNTTVTYYPKTMTRKLNQIDSAYTVVLNKGECYLVQSWQYQRGQGDLTGTYIKSDKPVGVLSGHVRTALLQGFTEQPPDSKDHICEMLMPVSSWGRTFISVPFGTNPNKGDYFKAVTRSNNVKFDIFTDLGPLELKFSPGQNWAIFEGLNRPALWVASAPVQLAQFMYRANDSLETIFYDPSMVILPPVEQYISRINFATPGEVFLTSDGVKYISHYVTLVAQNEALTTLKINDRLVESISNIRNQVIPGTDMHWARIEVPPGQHLIESESGRFSGIIYGVGRFDSYAMVLGSSLENPYSEDKVPPTHSVTENCYELKGTITDEISDKSFGIYYAIVNRNLTNNFNWSIEPILPNSREIKFTAKPIDIYRNGRFVIDYYDKSGNRGTYTKIHNAVRINHPELIILKGIDWNDSTCFEHYIKNDGVDAITLTRIALSSDSRVSLNTNVALPFEIKGGDSVLVKICVNPKGDFETILGKIELNFDCEIKYSYNFRGDVMALDLAAFGYDFGDVLIGETFCDSIRIENRSNIPVEITDKTLFRALPEFYIDSVEYFPALLLPGESLKLEVCFSPGNRVIYQDTVFFINEFDFRVFAVIKGRGVAPEFESVALNWGKRRVGTRNDSTIFIKNKGNTQGRILFKQFSEISTPDFNSNALELLNASTVTDNDSIAVNLRFIPEKQQNYSLIAVYDSDWQLHPEFSVSLTGEPTIPEIQTFDYSFGDVQLYSAKPAIFDAIRSLGNEPLTIDSIYIYSGDAGSFNFNLTVFENVVIDINNTLKFPIEFGPMRLGGHEIIFAVVHDANPDYVRSVSYFKVTANSVAPKVEDFQINIVTNPTFTCLYQLGNLQITNIGEVQTDITGLSAVADNPDVYVRIVNFNPSNLQPGQTAEFEFEYYIERNVSGTITFSIELFGEYSIERKINVSLPADKITLNPMDDIIYATGDTITLRFSGKFNQSTDTLVSFSFWTDLRRDFLYPIDEKIYLNVKNNLIMNNYLLYEKEFFDKLEFIFSERLIKVSENSEWYFEKRFVGLLSPEQERVWNARVSSNECFESDEIQYKTILDDLCVFDLRHVLLKPDFRDVNIYPNPVNDLMKLKIVSHTDLSNVTIHITDVFGNMKVITSGYNFSRGNNEYYIKTSDLISGSYMLHFYCDNFEKNIMFVIIK